MRYGLQEIPRTGRAMNRRGTVLIGALWSRFCALQTPRVCAVCFALCLAFSSSASGEGAHLSRKEAIHIAEAKISRDFANSVWKYDRIAISYQFEDNIWAVLYRERTSASRCVVEVEDRTGKSRILIP